MKKILHEAKSLGLKALGLTGGEPFLRRKELMDLVDFCRSEMDLRVHIHSNGTIISRKEAEWVKQTEADITISLFGSNPRTHDAITNSKGSMESTIRGLRHLVRTGTNLTVFVVPMKQNFHEILSLIELIDEEGVRHVRILSPSPTGRAMERFAELELSDAQVRFLGKELVRIQKDMGMDLRAGFCTRSSFHGLLALKGHEGCYAAENRIHIDAFGNVYPCTASSGRTIFSAGNLQMSSHALAEIWEFSPLFQFLRAFHSNPPTKCQECDRFQHCMSGCRVKMSYKHGNVSIADPECGGPFIQTK